MRTTKKLGLMTSSAALVLAGIVATAPAASAAPKSCTKEVTRTTVTASCAPNGTGFMFRAAATCVYSTLFQGEFRRYTTGAWAAPGTIARLDCKDVNVNAVVSGGIILFSG